MVPPVPLLRRPARLRLPGQRGRFAIAGGPAALPRRAVVAGAARAVPRAGRATVDAHLVRRDGHLGLVHVARGLAAIGWGSALLARQRHQPDPPPGPTAALAAAPRP